MSKLMKVVEGRFPVAVQNAVGKYGLTVAQAKKLAEAVQVSGMNPSRAMGFLARYSPEEVSTALSIRGELYAIDPPSVPVIIRAMGMTNFPLDREPEKLDLDAVVHTVCDYKFKEERIKCVRNFLDGGYDRKSYYQSLRGVDRYGWEDDDRYSGGEGDHDDYSDESFA